MWSRCGSPNPCTYILTFVVTLRHFRSVHLYPFSFVVTLRQPQSFALCTNSWKSSLLNVWMRLTEGCAYACASHVSAPPRPAQDCLLLMSCVGVRGDDSARLVPPLSVVLIARNLYITRPCLPCDTQTPAQIDIFGEISGISFTPLGDELFVGVADLTYSSMLQASLAHLRR